MKKVLFLFICITLSFASCQKGKPIVFNETIVEANDVVTNVMFKFDTQTETSADSGDFSHFDSFADSTLNVLDTQLKKIESLEVTPNGKDYKEAAIKYIESTIKTVEYKKKYPQTPKEQIDSVRNEYAKLFNELPVYSEKLKEAQKLFAESAGLELK